MVSFVAFGTGHSTVGFNSLISTFDPAFPRLYRRTIAFVQSCLKRLRHIRTAIKVNDAIIHQIITVSKSKQHVLVTYGRMINLKQLIRKTLLWNRTA